MNQEERLYILIHFLIEENPSYGSIQIPVDIEEQKNLLRSLFNLRPPSPINKEFLSVQDKYLQCELEQKGVIGLGELKPIQDGIYLWKGDITTLKVGSIVNAANSQMLGCFSPCHGCIDNVIHTYAGIQLRLACAELMKRQRHEEPTGKAKITRAFNLPCDYVIHTVGPIITNTVTKEDCDLLSSCYRSCLSIAQSNGIKSIAFCCISTGEYHFPNRKAAEIAIETVKQFRNNDREMEVIFNVFKETDYNIYQELLRGD